MVLLLGSASVSAKAPSDVADLVGTRGVGDETKLGNRGSTYLTMTHGTQYWWNAERKAYIGIRVAEGHYKSVSAAQASQCHQSAKAQSSQSHQATSTAESACMSAVNQNHGGNVKDLKLVYSEFSQADTEVILDALGCPAGRRPSVSAAFPRTAERWQT